MIYTLDEIGSIIAPIAKKYNIKTVWVFSSYARGEETETSDVDLVIDDAFQHGADVVNDRQIHQPTDRRGQRRFRKTVLEERIKVYETAA